MNIKQILSKLFVGIVFVSTLIGCGGEPSISGAPDTTVKAGEPYHFKPNTKEINDPKTFTIQNLPSWASFDDADGRLYGTPSTEDVATYENILLGVTGISAKDNSSVELFLDPFSIEVLDADPSVSLDVAGRSILIRVGELHDVTPTTENLTGDLQFNVQDLPSWAEFDETTGRVHGTPTDDDEYFHSGISFTVTGTSSVTGEMVTLYYGYSIFVQPTLSIDLEVVAYPYGLNPFEMFFNVITRNNTTFQTYYWDFNGDGIIDKSVSKHAATSYEFPGPGVYEATLVAVDNLSRVYTSNKTSVTVSDVPDQGPFGFEDLMVLSPLSEPIFAGQQTIYYVSNAKERGAIRVDYDMDGDGEIDVSQTGDLLSTLFYSYSNTGAYEPKVYVHFPGEIVEESTIVLDVLNVYTSSDEYIYINALNNEIPHYDSVHYNEQHRYQVILNNITPDNVNSIEWRFNDSNDLIGTGEFFELAYDHFYGRKDLLVEVTLNDGRAFEAKLAIYREKEKPSEFFFSLADAEPGVLDVQAASPIDFSVDIDSGNRFRILVQDQHGQEVRTVQEWTRPSGEGPWSFQFSWDGQNNDAQFVSAGTYYLIAEQIVNDAVLTYFPHASIHHYPVGIGYDVDTYHISTDFPRSYAPLHNRPLEVNFTLSHPAVLTGMVGFYSNIAYPRRLISNKVFPKGDHTIFWGGVDKDGILLEKRIADSILLGLWAEPLPQFAVYVVNDPELVPPTVEPEILNPQVNGVSKVTSRIDRVASLEWRILHATTGIEVKKEVFQNHPAGDIELTWDGKNDNGVFVGAGKYTHSLKALTTDGVSIVQDVVQRISY